MRRILVLVGVAIFALVGTMAWAAEFEITPAIQKQIDQYTKMSEKWAADSVVVKAVVAQNKKGPIPGMDNPKWKTVSKDDPIVKGFQTNAGGKFLKKKCEAAKTCVGAFLNAAQGEKVAFTDKTSSYIHKGAAKFDVPFTTEKPWQGKPEYEEDLKAHLLQVSVPVLSDGKPIGALVVEMNLTKLAKSGKKK
jgi:hypothetical protein